MQTAVTSVIVFGTLGLLTIIILSAIIFYRLWLSTRIEQIVFQAKLEVREQTFNQISEEIHDNIGQLVSLAKIQLSMIEPYLGKEYKRINPLKETLINVSEELRLLAKGLNSNHIRNFGLVEIIQNLAGRINGCDSSKVEVVVNGIEQSISDNAKFIAFRLLQEIVQNCLKHSKAAMIKIDLFYSDQMLKLNIEDDGVGFDINNEKLKTKGLGLQNIRRRIKLIGGIATITSSPLKGTKVVLQIPYPTERQSMFKIMRRS
jgi:two-component system, NarL family, sensor kinase